MLINMTYPSEMKLSTPLLAILIHWIKVRAAPPPPTHPMKLFSYWISSSPSLFKPVAAILLLFWLPRGFLSSKPPPQQEPEGSTCPNRDLYRSAMCAAQYAVQRFTQHRSRPQKICYVLVLFSRDMWQYISSHGQKYEKLLLGVSELHHFYFLGYISWLQELGRFRITWIWSFSFAALLVSIWLILIKEIKLVKIGRSWASHTCSLAFIQS